MKDKDTLDETTSDSTASSADCVDSHLQRLEDRAHIKQGRPLSPEEQLFTEEELARLINTEKLSAIMSQSDNLVSYLTSEIDKF